MAKKLTTTEFIEKARAVHGDQYDYSKTVYDTWNKIVIIGCKKHGYFEQRANGHTNGKGCKKCAGRGWTQEDFLNEARLVHGDTYDYSQSSFLGLSRKVTIICSEHGEFTLQANNHINGKGCPDCGRKQSELSRRKWTKAKALQFAQKYSTRTDFYNGSPKAYHAAKRFGFLDEICAHMHEVVKRWSKAELISEAKKYQSRSEFVKECESAYRSALNRGIIDEVCAHMQPLNKSWNMEKVRTEASKYQHRGDFHKLSSSAYNWARDNNAMDDVCAHMARNPNTREIWNEEEITKEALKYTKRVDFMKGSPGAYNASKRKGILDKVCDHMEVLWKKKWDEKSLIEEASKYSRRVNFQKANSGAYSAAIKRGIIDTVCAHMPKPKVWTEDDIRVCAKEYSSRSEFMYENAGAYEAAHRMGIIHSVCEHMERASTGFKVEKSAYVYVLCCEIGEKMKIGISNSPKRRIRNLRGTTPFPFHIAEMFKFESGQDALDIESQAHKMGDVLGVVQNNGETSREWMKFDGSIIQWVRRQHKEIQER